MDTDAKGQLGGIECSKDARERLAKDSGKWTCAGCAKSNADIMKEREEAVKEIEEKEGKRKEEEIPEELTLAYRDELSQKEGTDAGNTDKGKGKAIESEVQQATSVQLPAVVAPTATVPVTARPSPPSTSRPARIVPAPPAPQVLQQSPDRSLAWLDTCIYGVVAMLLFMVVRKFDVL